MEDTPLSLTGVPNSTKTRHLSYAASAVCCLLSASFTVFSSYTGAFENELDYTPLQINYISISAVMGLYSCVPFIGYMADAYRLSHVGIIGCVGYAVGYAGCSWVVCSHQSWQLMALFFAIVGVGCSATFIASLVNCARLFPEIALLAISLPTTSYGFSSLMYAKILSIYSSTGGELYSSFAQLALCTFCVGLLSIFAPIWGHVDVSAGPAGVQASEEIPENAEALVLKFFHDPKTLLFLLSFVFVSGPLEMYQNNVGLIVKNLGGSTSDVAHQVALFTGLSTLTRLAVGAVIDAFKIKPPVLLLVLLVLVSFVDFGFAQKWSSLDFMSTVSGIGYGASFTSYPLTVSKVWGIEGFATYWGMFILGPAIGLLIFGMQFGHEIEESGSISTTFRICALAAILSCILIGHLRLHRAYD